MEPFDHDLLLVRTRHEDLLDGLRGRRPTRTEARPDPDPRRSWWRRAAARR